MFDDDHTEALTKALFGQHAVRVPTWTYVQNQGDGTVMLAAGSTVADRPHPARYGSNRTHQFILGETIIRPHLIIATDALRGEGPGSLVTSDHDLHRMLSDGEVLFDGLGMIDDLLRKQR
jgi:hypothetical protein